MPRNDRGFTLIEILVALSILAIALMAALRAAGQGTTNVAELRSRTLAGWVAENTLALHRARGDWLPVGEQEGKSAEGGMEFVWREKVIATPNNSFRRVDIRVFAADHPEYALVKLTGFVTNPVTGAP